ncbi:MAG: ABC-F family ATP-binding cassette domain-containing protein [Desulfobacter sp.]|nr:ABC-F family ATP-binding cassette domain-containing protein [Desulfobacter sp.]
MIHLTQISKQFGSQIILKKASLQILKASRSGLVGANGSGKTSIFRMITGKEDPDEGEIAFSKKIKIGYFSQNVAEMNGCTVLEEVMAGSADVVLLGRQMQEMEAAMAQPMDDDGLARLLEQYGQITEQFENRGGYDLETRAQTVLTGLGIVPDQHDLPVESFSGGWKMRIALAKILTLNPNVLLLDEPTNHLDMESILWLENWLINTYKGAVLMTCHDHDFMNKVVSRTIEVANHTTTTYGGNYDFYIKEREIRKTQLLASYRRQQEMLAKEENFIARFKARVSHAAQVQSRIKKLEKIERIEIPPSQQEIRFKPPKIPRSGEDVLGLTQVSKTWDPDKDSSKMVFSNVSTMITRQSKTAVVGVNGAGKSTLLKIMAQKTSPSSGEVKLGASVTPGYFSQHAMDILDPDKTVFQTVQEVLPLENIGVIRNLCASFLFSGDDVDKKIKQLSGGEKSRVVLATLLGRPKNFLILDEPTNHLDIQSRQILLKALQEYTGTLILVSHDRYFLRNLVNQVFEIDQGELFAYPGDYEYFLAKTGHNHKAI